MRNCHFQPQALNSPFPNLSDIFHNRPTIKHGYNSLCCPVPFSYDSLAFLLSIRVPSSWQWKELTQVALMEVRKLYTFITLSVRVWHLSAPVLGRWSSEATEEDNQPLLLTFSLENRSYLGFFPFFFSVHSSVHSFFFYFIIPLWILFFCSAFSMYIFLTRTHQYKYICVFVCMHSSGAARGDKGLVRDFQPHS